MKESFKRKIVLIIFIFLFCFCLNREVHASYFVFNTQNNTFDIGEEFSVDILINTENSVINGIEGSINFSNENISFVRAEEAGSVVDLWIEKPNLKENNINFSGIITDSFGGTIDKSNSKNISQGLVIRLIFEAKKTGDANISSFKSYLTLNDGFGTIENIPSLNKIFYINNIYNKTIIKNVNDFIPKLSAEVVRDPNLFDNKYVLIFDAKDNETGIKEVLIKEGRRSWKKIESPYLLEDQSRHSIITLKATDYSDSSIVISIKRLPYKFFTIINIIIIFISSIFFFFIIKFLFISKFYEKHKKIHN